MSDRWRDPVVPIAIEEAVGYLTDLGDGRLRRDLEYTLKPRDIARIRLGYVCLYNGCFEPQEKAFPERCAVCGFLMREYQTEVFSRLYLGEEKLRGSGVDEELARMADEKEREREKHASNGKTRILLPRGV